MLFLKLHQINCHNIVKPQKTEPDTISPSDYHSRGIPYGESYTKMGTSAYATHAIVDKIKRKSKRKELKESQDCPENKQDNVKAGDTKKLDEVERHAHI